MATALLRASTGNVTTPSMPPQRLRSPGDANLRYQDALDWRAWIKGGYSFRNGFLLFSALFTGRTACPGLSICLR